MASITPSDQVPQLPIEAVCYMLQFADAKTLGQTAAVCQEWRNASYDESQWQRVCQEKGWEKKEPGQTWRDFAISQVKRLKFFRGECLKYVPSVSISYPTEEESDDAILDFWKQLETQKIFDDECPLYGTDIKILDPISRNEVTTLPHAESIILREVIGNRCVTLDTQGDIRVWDIPNGNVCYQGKEKTPETFMGQTFGYTWVLDGNILTTLRFESSEFTPSGYKTAVTVHFLDNPENNFTFTIADRATYALLKGNILAINTFQSGNLLHFVDVKTKRIQTFSDNNPFIENKTLDEMRWQGCSLYILRRAGDVASFERWNFETLQPNRRRPLPLLISPTEEDAHLIEASIFLEDTPAYIQLKKGLESWVEEAPNEEEKKSRGQCRGEIMQAYRDQSWFLSLNEYNLTSLPPEIGLLTKVTHLWLSKNNLTELPKEIGSLTKLAELDLSSNQLTELPPEIGRLTRLITFRCDNNCLKELPAEFFNLSNLKTLMLENNQIEILSPDIIKLRYLKKLYLKENRLVEIPKDIGRLDLDTLDLQRNQLVTLPIEILDLPRGIELDLSYNLFPRQLQATLRQKMNAGNYYGPREFYITYED